LRATRHDRRAKPPGVCAEVSQIRGEMRPLCLG